MIACILMNGSFKCVCCGLVIINYRLQTMLLCTLIVLSNCLSFWEKRVQKCIESFSLLVSFEGYGGENRSICLSFKSPVAGAWKNKSATTDVKFRTKTPVSKELSYILHIK